MVDYIKIVNESERFGFDETFNIYKACGTLLSNDEILGRKLLINLLENRSKLDHKLDEVFSELIEAAGFYPYLLKENLNLDSTDSIIRKEYHHSENLEGKYFHGDQKYLLSLLHTDKNVVVSAPTSFGKSLLIEEIVASKAFRNIIVVQPTLALLDETRKKLLRYRDTYKIIVRTSQKPSEVKGNLFLLTAERVNEYRYFPKIDFLIIDEFYKLSAKRDDERADYLNNAFHGILEKYNCKFYLLGPNIDGISEGFAEKYNALFYKSNYKLVDCDEIDLYGEYGHQFGVKGAKKEYKEQMLFDLLFGLNNEQTIIYCSSPTRVRYLSKKFYAYLAAKNMEAINQDLPILEWIKNYISPSWGVIKLLTYGIGIHDGALLKHITSSVIDYFNQNKLKYLFCTTTIIEGVNTSAKNIIFFDNHKGYRVLIDFFDYSNIKGRAGRFMIHYKGRIYNFNPIPNDTQIVVDIPFFEQNPISNEVLINLPEAEVKNKDTEQYKALHQLPAQEKALFRDNGLNIFGQKAILDRLRREIDGTYQLLHWNRLPNYAQLSYVLSLAWNNLLKPGEATKPMTVDKLIKTTFDYGYNQKIEYLIQSRFLYLRKKAENSGEIDEDLFDDAVRESFQILKHWFQYKIPKFLLVISELQSFVCQEKGLEPGNYSHYASLIENDFIRENLAILTEFGIPSSAIRKMEAFIPADTNEDDVLDIIKKNRLFENQLFLQYEREKILENL